MFKRISNFLDKELPIWIMDICYAILLVEASGVVVIYFRFDILIEIVELFA